MLFRPVAWYDSSTQYKDDSATAVITVTVSGRLRDWSARTPEKWVCSIEGYLTPLTIVGGVEHHRVIDVDCITIPTTTFLDGEPDAVIIYRALRLVTFQDHVIRSNNQHIITRTNLRSTSRKVDLGVVTTLTCGHTPTSFISGWRLEIVPLRWVQTSTSIAVLVKKTILGVRAYC